MASYRMYRLDEDGHVVERLDFDASDDAAAVSHAQTVSPGARCELWELGRRVHLPNAKAA